jgi:hypothetical protein
MSIQVFLIGQWRGSRRAALVITGSAKGRIRLLAAGGDEMRKELENPFFSSASPRLCVASASSHPAPPAWT